MSRLRRIEHTHRFFFVTTNLARRVPALSPEEREICLDWLHRVRGKHKFSLHAYVVMPDHVHILLGAFGSSLPALMRDWKSQSGFAIAKLRCARGPIWQERYFDFIPRRVRDFWQKMQYIHRNPLERGLVTPPDMWRWSSESFYTGSGPVPVPVDPPHLPLDGNALLWPHPWKPSGM